MRWALRWGISFYFYVAELDPKGGISSLSPLRLPSVSASHRSRAPEKTYFFCPKPSRADHFRAPKSEFFFNFFGQFLRFFGAFWTGSDFSGFPEKVRKKFFPPDFYTCTPPCTCVHMYTPLYMCRSGLVTENFEM